MILGPHPQTATHTLPKGYDEALRLKGPGLPAPAMSLVSDHEAPIPPSRAAAEGRRRAPPAVRAPTRTRWRSLAP